MSLGLAFWVIMIVWVVFSFAARVGYVGTEYGWGGTLLLVVLFGILGWQVFGPVLHR
jgi:hypothetical protein